MPDDKSRIKQGQRLSQTAQDPGDPRNMTKILGVAGEGLWDFLGKAQEYLVPQSVEELAMEGSPAGKAIGLIPPKYIQPFVKRLMTMIENQKGWTPEVQQAAWEAVDRNPRIAAHVDEIRPITALDTDLDASVLGDYEAMNKVTRELRSEGMPPDYAKLLDEGRGPGFGAKIRLDPKRATYGSVFEPPARVADHELTHAAQDIWNPQALGAGQRYQTYDYNVNPFEIGANATADPMGGNYWARIERAINARGVRDAMGSPERVKMIRDMNRTMAGQGRQIQLDPKSQMLRIVMDR